MYKMKDVCEMTNISYETLKYYCNEGFVPNHKRDKNNHRIFTENDVNWIKGLMSLRQCGMSIKDMKIYMDLCFIGFDSIKQRKEMLDKTRDGLLKQIKLINESLEFIDDKQKYYDDLLDGKIEYQSYLIDK